MKQIIALLQQHNIQLQVRGGRVRARENWTKDGVSGFRSVDVTDWSYQTIREWLGH